MLKSCYSWGCDLGPRFFLLQECDSIFCPPKIPWWDLATGFSKASPSFLQTPRTPTPPPPLSDLQLRQIQQTSPMEKVLSSSFLDLEIKKVQNLLSANA